MKIDLYGATPDTVFVQMRNPETKEACQIYMRECHHECDGCPAGAYECEYCNEPFEEDKTWFSVTEDRHIEGEPATDRRAQDYLHFMEAFDDFTRRVKEVYADLKDKKGAWFDGSQN